MKKNYLIITNNPEVKNLIEKETDYELIFLDGDVQAVVSACETAFLQRGFSLAADPMAGRHARPFSCLTLILEEGGGSTPLEHWERITDYSLLNSKRQDEIRRHTERINQDYQALDCSLTRTALHLY